MGNQGIQNQPTWSSVISAAETVAIAARESDLVGPGIVGPGGEALRLDTIVQSDPGRGHLHRGLTDDNKGRGRSLTDLKKLTELVDELAESGKDGRFTMFALLGSVSGSSHQGFLKHEEAMTLKALGKRLELTDTQTRTIQSFIEAADRSATSGYAEADVDRLMRSVEELKDVGVPDRTPLLSWNSVWGTPLEDRGRQGQAEVVVRLPFDSIAWVVHPMHWASCIRQVQRIEFMTPPGHVPEGVIDPPSGLSWSSYIRETVNLAYPVRLGSTTLETKLRVRLNHSADGARARARVDYDLAPNGSALLDLDDGFIEVVPVPRAPQISVVIVKKTIRFKTKTFMERTFDINPDGLSDMLRYWVSKAHEECP